jgi:hypothetical protein
MPAAGMSHFSGVRFQEKWLNDKKRAGGRMPQGIGGRESVASGQMPWGGGAP